MPTTPASPSERRARTALSTVLVWIILVVQVGWFATILSRHDTYEAAHRDWVQFPRTGQRVVSWQLDDLYARDFTDDGRPEFEDRLYFLYPPFVAWVTVPLAPLPPLVAYGVLVLFVAAVTLSATWIILCALAVTGMARWFPMLTTMASAPWSLGVLLGHLSATLVLWPALAMRAWFRGRPAWAGAALGVLVAKPNWGLPILLLLAVGRRWTMLAGALAAVSALFVVSLPLGLEAWHDWIVTMVNYRQKVTETFPWQQATLLAAIRSMTGRTGSDPVVWVPWLGVAGTLFGCTALVWIRRGPQDPFVPRLLGVALLGVIATTPYAFFYDAILPLPAALLLWTRPDSWFSPTLRRAALWVSGFTWAWMLLQFWVLKSSVPSLVGIGFAVWLILELLDLWQGPARSADPPSLRTGAPRADSRR